MLMLEGLAEGVQRRGADVAVHDAERAESEGSHAGLVAAVSTMTVVSVVTTGAVARVGKVTELLVVIGADGRSERARNEPGVVAHDGRAYPSPRSSSDPGTERSARDNRPTRRPIARPKVRRRDRLACPV